jgi:hypothetical protein
MSPDFVTILTADAPVVLAKTFTGPGLALKQYDDARNFSTREVEVNGIHDLFGVLQELDGDAQSCIIRGRFVGEAAALEVIQPEKPGRWRRLSALFPDVGRRWFCFDFDKVPAPGWKANPVAAVEKIVIDRLPVEFAGRTFAYRFTASAGFSDEVVSVHVWFWLDASIPSDLWRGWIKNKAVAVDTATANAVQIHYTAAPLFLAGALDPMAALGAPRLGIVEGWSGDEVVGFRIDPTDGFIKHTASANGQAVTPDACAKPGLIGAFCRAYEVEDVLAEFLPNVFEWETKGGDRRLNYLASASGGKGGAFVSEDRKHVVNTHNSDPCDNRLTNLYDLVRCHSFGHLDEDAPADTPINKMPSSIRMGEFCATLPPVVAEMEAAKGPSAAEAFAAAIVTPEHRGRFSPVYPAELRARPRPRWRVKGLIAEGPGVGMIFGESTAGKSFVAIDLGLSVALGREWNGLRVKPGRVFYIAAEGGGGIPKRIEAYGKHHGLDLDAAPFGVIEAAPNFREEADPKAIAEVIGCADLIFVDTLAQVTAGGNENSGEDMGKVISYTQELSKATGAVVVIIHHAGKDASRGARGWSGVKAAVDFEIAVERNGDTRRAKVTKSKDGDGDGAWPFKLTRVDLGIDEDGESVNSCVVEFVPPSEVVRVKRPSKGTAPGQILLDLERLRDNQEAEGGDRDTVFRIDAEEAIEAAKKHVSRGKDPEKDRRRDNATRALASLRRGRHIDFFDEQYLIAWGGLPQCHK